HVQATPDLVLRVAGSYFRERESGGTEFNTATVQLARYSIGATWTPARFGRVDVSLFGHAEEFDQERPRVDATRSKATLASTQRIPTYDVGDSLVWTLPLKLRRLQNVVSIGEDLRWIDSHPHDALFLAMATNKSTIG